MRFANLLNKFPPPKFLDVPFSGIVFSDTKIKTLVLDKKNHKLVSFSESEIPTGIIESGIVKNEQALTEVLTKEKSKLSSPFVRFVIPDEVSYTFSASVPVSAAKDISESVEFILEENVPLPLSDISFDFTPLGVVDFSATVIVTAVSSSSLASYLGVLRSASLSPLSCTNESQSMARSVIPENNKGNYAIICIHTNSVGIYITSGNIVEFSSTLAISPDDSESFASMVTLEFKKVLDYWKDKNTSSRDLIHCFICGRHEVAKKVEQEMQKNSTIKTSLANVWTNTFSLQEYIPDMSFEDSLRFGSAVGLFV